MTALHFLLSTIFLYKVSTGLSEDILRRDLLRTTNNLPFNITFPLSDNEVKDTDIAYYLFNRQRRNILINKAIEVVNKRHPLKILIHGWSEHYNVEWCNNTIDAYLRKGIYNVISVDWSSKGDSDYLTSSLQTKPVGEKIGEFVVKLHQKGGLPYKNIHVISHSLGAHVAGFIGKKVYELSRKKISRITALDPAAPIFDLITTGEDGRLSKDDAYFVDIIHTDGGRLGFSFSIGTADFFPNGGTAVQPGCSLVKLDVKYEDLFCSHASSHQYFIKSIRYRKFLAKPCESWDKFIRGLCEKNKSIIFGDGVPMTAAGNYYLHTNENDIKV